MLQEILMGIISLIPEFVFLILISLSPTRLFRRIYYNIPLKQKYKSLTFNTIAAIIDMLIIIGVLFIILYCKSKIIS